MGTIADKLRKALESKALLKQRLTEKGVDVSSEDVLYNLADKVSEISTIPTLSNPGTSADLLTGKQLVSQDGTICTGSMPNNGAVSQTLSAGGSYSIPKGYHNGSGKVTSSSLASQTSATAAAENILTGKTAWVNGSKVTGTMPNNGSVSQSLSAGGSYTVPKGYHSGSGKVTAASLSSQTSGTAAAANVESGKTAWVNGSKITGTLASSSDKTYDLDGTNYLEISGDYYYAHGVSNDKTIIPSGAKVSIKGFSLLLGDATADDVKAGKTFTSQNGAYITGTGSSGGGTCEVSILNQSSCDVDVEYIDATTRTGTYTTLMAGRPTSVNAVTPGFILITSADGERTIMDGDSPLDNYYLARGWVILYKVEENDTSSSIFITDY